MRSPTLLGLSSAIIFNVPGIVQSQSIDNLVRQADEAYSLREFAQAEAIWRQILRLSPNNATAYTWLGINLGQQNRYEESEAALLQAIQLDSDYALAHYNHYWGISFPFYLNNRTQPAHYPV